MNSKAFLLRQLSINVLSGIIENNNCIFRQILCYLLYKDKIMGVKRTDIEDDICIDTILMEEIYNKYRSLDDPNDPTVPLPLNILKDLMKKEDEETPFNLSKDWYEEQIKNIIKYSDNYKSLIPVVTKKNRRMFPFN
jgi:hypothetical protein